MKINITWAVIITLLTAVVTAIISFIQFNKNIKIEQITKERTKWREEIRRISKELISLDYSIRSSNEILKATHIKSSLLAELEMRLNPYDDFDQSILNIARGDLSNQDNKSNFIRLISILLKQDWEVVKYETKWCKFLRNKPCYIPNTNKKEVLEEMDKGFNELSRNNYLYWILSVIGILMSIYFMAVGFFNLPNKFIISIDNVALITCIYSAVLYIFSKKFNINIGLSSNYKLLPAVSLAVLLNYFLLYENGDVKRAAASGVMVFATAILVSVLVPKE
ncbi:hypothetical protein [uncultured Haemophilus sp.]|uniref:hypothetical protein n=1 Tax=uncultured Haemophilus sp. TaxID=237779 RepID=UPI00258E51E5|nr:hypothetical protein [uncultured Haemophilus sp.]